MSSPQYVTFHNPFEHPTYEADGVTRKIDPITKKPVTTPAVSVKFELLTHESGRFDKYDLAPGEVCMVPAAHAHAVPSHAPQLVMGPAPILSETVEPKKKSEKPAETAK